MMTLRKSSGIAATSALAVACFVGGASTSAVAGKETAKLTPTAYSLEASGYTSRVKGGDVPTGSDKAAYTVVSCTNKAGLSNTNSQAEGDAGNGLVFQDASTRAWTAKSGDRVSAWSRNHIEQVTLADTPTGDLVLQNLTSTSHAWHDATGFHSQSTSTLGSITFSPTVGEDQSIPVPSPGQSVTIPGVADIGLGAGNDKVGDAGATTGIDAVRVDTLFSDTTTFLGHARAWVTDEVKNQLFGGSAFATKSTVLGVLTSGRTVPTSVPCVGTKGNWTTNRADEATLSDQANGSALMSRQRSGMTAPGGRPEVTTISRVGLVDLGGGLLLHAVKAQAHVMKTPSGYSTDIDGTSIGSITYNGTEQPFPDDTNAMEIPGVAHFGRAIVERGLRSIAITGLRVTMLDGTGAVYDLAFAKALLHPKG
jgi:hypothetical protein